MTAWQLVGHWAFWHMKLTAIICLSDCQTVASLCAKPNAQTKLY